MRLKSGISRCLHVIMYSDTNRTALGGRGNVKCRCLVLKSPSLPVMLSRWTYLLWTQAPTIHRGIIFSATYRIIAQFSKQIKALRPSKHPKAYMDFNFLSILSFLKRIHFKKCPAQIPSKLYWIVLSLTAVILVLAVMAVILRLESAFIKLDLLIKSGFLQASVSYISD